MLAIMVFELVILAIICILLLRVFVSFKRTPWYALLTTWLGWLLCFSIVFLVPIDILDTDHETCLDAHDQNEKECDEPVTYLPGNVMIIQWKVLWWGTMVLSWLVFPLLSSFFLAGEFSVGEKIVRAVKENVIIYCALAGLGVIGLIALWVSANLSKDAFMEFILALANAYGLILTICLMGYGLVDIPRYMWRKANRGDTLKYYCVMAFKYKEAIEVAKADLEKTLKTVKTIADKVREHDPYRKFVDIILAQCPLEYEEVTGDVDIELSYAKLVQIHQRVAEDTHSFTRAVCLYEKMLVKAFKTEDVIRTRAHPQMDWKVYWSFKAARTHRFAKVVDVLEYIWEVHLFTITFRTLAVLSGLLSLFIVWCEITLTADKSKHDLSPFSQIIRKIPLEGLAKQLFCLVIIFYMSLCAYTTLFKLKLFNYYRLVPHQMSDGNSIMFSANYLCRLAAPLSYNFLTLINADDRSFTQVMGSMNAFPVLGQKFMIFFPVLVVLLCLATIFNLYSKIGAMCCIKKLRYRPSNDEKLIDEGERILQEEREIKEGKGPVQLTTKQTIRSTIKEEVNKITHKEDTEDGASRDVVHAPKEPAPPPSLHASIAQKYGLGRANDDLLPSTSRFSSKRTSTTLPPTNAESSGGGMKPNLSGGNLAAQNTAPPPSTGMRFNLSGNNLAAQGASSSSSSSSSSFMRPNLSSGSLSTSVPTNTSINTNARGGAHMLGDDLLPPTSRFAKKPAPPPPSPSAILVSAPPDQPPAGRSDTKSLLGGLFGKRSTFSLLPDTSSNV